MLCDALTSTQSPVCSSCGKAGSSASSVSNDAVTIAESAAAGAGGDMFRQLPAGDDKRHAGFGRADAGLAVQGRGVGAELAHVAEDGHTAAGRKRRHGAQRRRPWNRDWRYSSRQ